METTEERDARIRAWLYPVYVKPTTPPKKEVKHVEPKEKTLAELDAVCSDAFTLVGLRVLYGKQGWWSRQDLQRAFEEVRLYVAKRDNEKT